MQSKPTYEELEQRVLDLEYTLQDVTAALQQARAGNRAQAESAREPEGDRQSGFEDLVFLSLTAAEFFDLPPEQDICSVIGKRLREIAGDAVVLVNRYDKSTNFFRVQYLQGLGRHTESIVRLLQREPVGMRVAVNDAEAMKMLQTGKLCQRPEGVYELAFGTIPRGICQIIEKLLDLGTIYTVGFARGEELFGDAVIIARRGGNERLVAERSRLIEAFIHQAAIAFQRKAAEEELRESEQRFKTITENLPGGVFAHDLEGRLLFVNEEASKNTGYSKQELLAMSVQDIDTGGFTREGLRELWQSLAPGDSVTVQSVHRRKDNTEYPVEIHLSAARFDQRPIMLPVVVDITERRQAEETLLWQQRKISMNNRVATAFLSSTSDAMYGRVLDVLLAELASEFGLFGYLDSNGDLVCPSMTRGIWEKCRVADKSIVFARSSWAGLWGRCLLEKRSICANEGLELPPGHVNLENALAVPIVYGDEVIGQFVVANKTGGYSADDRALLESAATQAAPILNACLDEARQKQEREKLEKQLLHAQQMEAIGTLAGGIAHDFNNILSSVIGYTELSLEQIESGSPLHSNLSQILSAGMRARELVKQILTLSRREEQEKRPTPIVPMVKEALKMLRSTIPASIHFREHICNENLVIQADPTQIHQVIMNLVTNAVHAMAEMEGTLEVWTRRIRFDRSIDQQYRKMPSGDYVQITVRDTGEGIAEEYKDRIFEPYFTTKEKGHGTGLGLSVVHGIVESHNGQISVCSRRGEGTSFHVYLPLAETLSPELPAAGRSKELPTGYESILVVDDEVPIVKMHQQSLERLGYRITVRSSSMEALAAFRAAPARYDLVLTDMAMPQMTGDRLARAVKEVRPEVPVILCTGFGERIAGSRKDPDIDGILMKPIDKKQMAHIIRELLDGEKTDDY